MCCDLFSCFFGSGGTTPSKANTGVRPHTQLTPASILLDAIAEESSSSVGADEPPIVVAITEPEQPIQTQQTLAEPEQLIQAADVVDPEQPIQVQEDVAETEPEQPAQTQEDVAETEPEQPAQIQEDGTERVPLSTTCKGLLFGLNYQHCASSRLNGCVNDVRNMKAYLTKTLQMPCDVYTDDVDRANTSQKGIIKRLTEFAAETRKHKYKFVWIHYSGHGTSEADRSGDEVDGFDECLVPSDYETAGMITDDVLAGIFNQFNPTTRIVFVFDCCHSGTIADLKYSFELNKTCTIENKTSSNTMPKMISLSGCLDYQVSMDVYGAFAPREFSGAMSACLLFALKEKPALRNDVFALMTDVLARLKAKGMQQIPKIAASYDVCKDVAFIPKL